MAKKIIESNARVEVWSERLFPYIHSFQTIEGHKKDAQALCDELIEHRMGHRPQVVCDTEEVCSFCGSGWEDPPGCCEAAMDETEEDSDNGS